MRNHSDFIDKGFDLVDRPVPVEEETGWDARAPEYALLPEKNPVYRLGKELLYKVVEKHMKNLPEKRSLRVLDFNCGCGNDFPFFLENGWQVVGCDGSPGMLNEALKRYPRYIQSGQLKLYLGNSENLNADSLDAQRFDLVFSTTGGFSYVDDRELIREHEVLMNMLKPGGKMILAHLSPHCPADTAFSLLRLHPRQAFRRWKRKLNVPVKGSTKTMYLRSQAQLKRLLRESMNTEAMYGILALTPPYQSGYLPSESMLKIHRSVELKIFSSRMALRMADQVAMVLSPKNPKK